MGTVVTLGIEWLIHFVSKKSTKKLSMRKFLMIMIAPILIAVAVIEGAGVDSASMLNTFYTYLAMYIGVLIGHNIDKTYGMYLLSNHILVR